MIIVGGSCPTFTAEQCLQDSSVDMVVLGEGEFTMHETICRINSGLSFESLDGITYRESDRIVINPKTQWITDLDDVPFPSRDLLPMDLYKRYGVPHSITATSHNSAPIVTSRGRPARCIYCSSTSSWGHHY